MKVIFAIFVYAVSLCCLGADFYNENYILQKIPTTQYEAIKDGAFAECFAKAKSISKVDMPSEVNCEAIKDAYGSNYFGYSQACRQAIDQESNSRKQTASKIVLGCMASQGWEFR